MIHRGARKPYIAVPLPPEPFELQACYRYCEAMADARRHNYPVASFFAAAELRKHIYAVYAFARTADDFADEPEFSGRRARELDRWEDRLEACFHGEPPDHPVFVALADTVHKFDLPITPFAQMIAGFRMDVDARRYPTYLDLRNYTALAAEPVGEILLTLHGYRDPALHAYAADLSSALAMATFWQSIRDDLQRDRVYVPTEDLRHFGLTEADLSRAEPPAELGALVRFEVARTRALFQRGRPLVDAVGPELAIELALIWNGGMRILAKTERVGDRITQVRPRLNAADKAEVVLRALRWRGRSLTHRRFRRVLR